MVGVTAVSYKHLDVYKRQSIASVDDVKYIRDASASLSSMGFSGAVWPETASMIKNSAARHTAADAAPIFFNVSIILCRFIL